MRNVTAVFILLPVLIVLLTVPVLIGVYVYRDASRRGMNAVLWTLIALLTPSLIGFILYLLLRGDRADLACPNCGGPVTEQYLVCPNCGAKLRPFCPNCAVPVEPDWKVCPKCAQPLPEVWTGVETPVQRKDKGLKKILIAIIAVSAVLLVSLICAFLLFTTSGGSGSVSMREVSMDEYYREQESEEIAGKVRDWMEQVGASNRRDRAFALCYGHASDTETTYFYLLYVPGAGKSPRTGIGKSSGLFGPSICIELDQTGDDGSFFCLQASSKKEPALKIRIDGKTVPCQVTAVDYNPTLFYIVPRYDEVVSAGDVLLPERVSVVKYTNNYSEGVAAVEEEDLMLKILGGIDGAEPLESGHPAYEEYDFQNGFDIVVEYKIHEGLALHEDMTDFLLSVQDSGYYLMDNREGDGRYLRQMDEDFYHLLADLFAQPGGGE